MIGQVRADLGRVVDHVKAQPREIRPGPDPRQHEQVRRRDGACRQDHLAP